MERLSIKFSISPVEKPGLFQQLNAVLFELPARRIFALKSDPYRLASLRSVRHERLRGATGNYTDPNFVIKEMDYALRIFKRKANWHIIDVTSKPIEEIASEILPLVAKNQKQDHK